MRFDSIKEDFSKYVKKNKRLLKYIACGGASSLIELIVFLAVENILDIYFAALVSFFCGLISSFLLNKIVVFQSKTNKGDTTVEGVKFIILGLLNSQISSWMTVWLIGIVSSGVIAKVITIIIIAVWNYLIMGKLIFNNKKKTER